jgi:hypothetical protein
MQKGGQGQRRDVVSLATSRFTRYRQMRQQRLTVVILTLIDCMLALFPCMGKYGNPPPLGSPVVINFVRYICKFLATGAIRSCEIFVGAPFQNVYWICSIISLTRSRQCYGTLWHSHRRRASQGGLQIGRRRSCFRRPCSANSCCRRRPTLSQTRWFARSMSCTADCRHISEDTVRSRHSQVAVEGSRGSFVQ